MQNFGFDNSRSSNGCKFALQKIKIVQRMHVLLCSKNHDIHSDVQYYVPIKLCKTIGSVHLFKIVGTLKPENIKLN